MARISSDQVLGMLFDPDFESGGESDIDEDPAISLPQCEELELTPSRLPSPLIEEISGERETEIERELTSQGRRGGRGRGRRGRGRRVRASARSTDREQSRDRSPLRQGS